MRHIVVILATSLCIALVNSHPLPEEEGLRSEALDRLVMVEADNETALRSKRTIGILRQLFPGISQMIEQKVNAITGELFRILGPIVVQNFLGNRGMTNAGSSGDRGGSTVTVASPFDDEDEDDDNGIGSSGARVSISLPTYPPDDEDETESPNEYTASQTNSSTTEATSPSSTTEATRTSSTTEATSDNTSNDENEIKTDSTSSRSVGGGANNQSRTTAAVTDVNPEAEYRANEVAAESQNNEVRVQFADEQSNDAQPELTPLDEIESNDDDENRNKRFLNFGFGGAASTGGSGSGAGSGNFLFDIIRQAADGAARAAGTVYRVVAGTQSLGLGLSATRDLVPQDAAPAAAPASGDSSSTAGAASTTAPAASGAGNLPPLVAGSGSAQGNSSGSAAAAKTEEAVPGPVTRLFVIANRGISNLVQDLILRLAATSERIVNFKARLITSII